MDFPLEPLAVKLVILGLLTFVGFNVVLSITRYVRSHRKLWKFPTDSPNRIFGHLFDYPGLNDEGLAYQRDLVAKFPMLSVMWMVNMPILLVHHPSTLNIVLKSSNVKGTFMDKLLRPWIGDGLLTSHGDKWHRHRRLLTPAFHFDVLKRYADIKNRCADILVRKFEEAAETGTSIEAFHTVGMCGLDILLKCGMSYETHCQLLGNEHPYVEATAIIQDIMVDRFFKPWLYSDFLFSLTPTGRKFFEQCKYVHHVAETIIRKRQAEIDYQMQKSSGEEKPPCQDFLDILLTAKDKDGFTLTLEEIKDEVTTFMFAGYETVTSITSWALYSVAEHPDIQSRVHEELDSVLNNSHHTDITWEDLTNLPYLTMVIKETMRFHSPVHFFHRVLSKDTVIDGKIAPAGTAVSCELYNLHHNPLLWPNSMKFDPNRFLPENIKSRHSRAFLPFSAGSRTCLGKNFAMNEIKILLARILHRVTVRLDPDHKVEKCERMVIKAKDDIRLLVSAR
ncbi:hypothetical protein RRG08_056505 [Elysia crispata]|uniref:Cytochrome P450 n=1 Tax=Elysia crispata TaxID=231223 RepID=A0AAE1BCA3_9GAST|nr:hypothetical protein RRG08_056505 [Elysia crispata]